jgi:hypothetical protein
MQLLLTVKRHIALWMSVRLSATAPESLNGRGGPYLDVLGRALSVMENILSFQLSAIIKKLNAARHMLIWTLFWYAELVPKFVRTFQ